MAPINVYRDLFSEDDPKHGIVADIEQVRKLLETNPREILAHGYRLLLSQSISREERIEVALALVDRLDGDDRIHLWEALSVIVRIESPITDGRLYQTAKQFLSAAAGPSHDSGAIRDFLGDFRVFAHYGINLLERPSRPVSESDLFICLHQAFAGCENDRIDAVVGLLHEYIDHDSFLIRESVANGICSISTSSTLAEEPILRYQTSFVTMITRLCDDESWYVRSIATMIRELIL